jgi:hypothetical protein
MRTLLVGGQARLVGGQPRLVALQASFENPVGLQPTLDLGELTLVRVPGHRSAPSFGALPPSVGHPGRPAIRGRTD